MPTLDLKVQEIGPQFKDYSTTPPTPYPWYTGLVGGAEPHKCVNDSAGTSHDGDSSYLTITHFGIVQFYLFRQAEHWTVTSLTLNAVIKGDGLRDLQVIQFFLSRGDDYNDADKFVEVLLAGPAPCADYTLFSTTVTTNPWTGQPFTGSELSNVMFALNLSYGFFGGAGHVARVTLMSASVTYNHPTTTAACQ